jgi:hypothetical protein
VTVPAGESAGAWLARFSEPEEVDPTMRHRDTPVRVYDAPLASRTPKHARHAPALAWLLPVLLLAAALAYVLVGIYAQRYWP